MSIGINNCLVVVYVSEFRVGVLAQLSFKFMEIVFIHLLLYVRGNSLISLNKKQNLWKLILILC